MPNQVAIVGVHQSRYKAERTDTTLEDLVFQSATSILSQLNLTISDIDAVITASSDLVDGRVISSMVTSGPAGAYMKDYMNLSSSGEHALTLAYMRTLSGQFDTTLVMSWSKCSETIVPMTEHLSLDPFYQRISGMDGIALAAMQADAYQSRWSIPKETIAQVVINNRSNAIRNPYAHLREPVTMDEILASPIMAWPLRQLEIPPYSDGVCALVVTSASKAIQLCKNPAWIKGIGWSSDTYWFGDRDPDDLTSLKIAANQAYSDAGITNPRKQIDVIEIHDTTATHQLMSMEALGFCSQGQASKLIGNTNVGNNGTAPVNPSGGALSSNPVFATGLVRVAEAASQVMDSAGDHQVDDTSLALAHASNGLASQGNTVVILGREP